MKRLKQLHFPGRINLERKIDDRKNKTKIDLTYELNPDDSIIFDTGKRIYPKNLLTVLVFDLFLTSISMRSAAVDENINT